MRQITTIQLRNNLGEELKSLPFEITRRGKVIAVVLSPTEVQSYEQNVTEQITQVEETDKNETNYNSIPSWYKLGCEKAKTKFFKSKKAKLEPIK